MRMVQAGAITGSVTLRVSCAKAAPDSAAAPNGADAKGKTMTKQFLDTNHPMFRKAWVRWATTVFPLAWGAMELY